MNNVKIHPTAEVSKDSQIGEGTTIWHQAQIRENVKIGKNCIIGKGVYIDKGVSLGSNVKIQNYSSIYHNAILEDGVFIGPYVCLTNDKFPRAISIDETLKSDTDWKVGTTIIKKGASIGAGTILLPDIEVGEFALVGAGSLVTQDVPAFTLVFGSPATNQGSVCKCGNIFINKRGRQKSACKVCKDLG